MRENNKTKGEVKMDERRKGIWRKRKESGNAGAREGTSDPDRLQCPGKGQGNMPGGANGFLDC